MGTYHRGGINGCAVAHEAAPHGSDVMLVERNDLGADFAIWNIVNLAWSAKRWWKKSDLCARAPSYPD